NTVALVLCMLLVQAAWGLVRSEYTAGTMLTFGVPAWLAQSIIPLGFGAITLRFALRLMETLARLVQPEAGACSSWACCWCSWRSWEHPCLRCSGPSPGSCSGLLALTPQPS